MTTRLGADDLALEGTPLDDAVAAVGWTEDHGLDLAELSSGDNHYGPVLRAARSA